MVFGVIIYVAGAEQTLPTGKGQLPQTTLILGLVSGVLLLVATLIGRRAPVGFVALFAFLFGTQHLVGLPFLILAVWLLYRSYKVQKEAPPNPRRQGGARHGHGAAVSGRQAQPKAPPRKVDPAHQEGPVGARGQQALHAEEARPRRRRPSRPGGSAKAARPRLRRRADATAAGR